MRVQVHSVESRGLNIKVWNDRGVYWVIEDDKGNTGHYRNSILTMEQAIESFSKKYGNK